MNEQELSKLSIHEGIMAFVDVLGLSRFLKTNTPISNEDINKIEKLNAQIFFFESSLGHHGRFAKQVREYQTPYEGGDWGALSYSDNVSIFISGVNSIDSIKQLKGLFEILLCQLAIFQYESASDWKNNGFENFLMRGGIAFGYGYISENLVTGPAHLQAYNIEQSDPYPRIVIDQKIFEILDKSELEHKFLIIDCYGTVFIDYLEAWDTGDLQQLLRLREFVSENITKTTGDILLKYQWTARYYNYHCKRHGLMNCLIPNFEISDECFKKLE
jgi:hypothetical protein